MAKLSAALIIITLPLLIVLFIFQLIAFDNSWYDKQFKDLGIYQTLGEQTVKNRTANLWDYFNYQSALVTDNYTAREITHLRDIRDILTRVRIFSVICALVFICAVLILFFSTDYYHLFKALFAGSLAAMFSFLLVIWLNYFGFDWLFYFFHRLSFANDNWLLDPQTDKLIVLLPPEIFNRLAFRLFKLSLLANLLIGIIFANLQLIWQPRRD